MGIDTKLDLLKSIPEHHKGYSALDRALSELAVLKTITGMPKTYDYYKQTLKARGVDPKDRDFNMGNTWISSLSKELWGVRIPGGPLSPIRVFDRTRDPEAFSKMKKATGIERSNSGRSFAKWPDVVYIAEPEATEEELSHQLNFAFSNGSVAYGKTGDRAQDDALAGAKKIGLGGDEAYYVFGKRDERVNAMAMAKHAVMRAKGEPTPLLADQGEGAIGEFIGKAKQAATRYGRGRPDDPTPVRAVIRAYDKLSKMKPDEMTPEQREAWKDLSDASVWDQLAKTEKNRGPSADKEVMADIGGGTSDKKMTEGLQRRAGAAGEVADAGIAWLERQAKKTADMDVPVLSGAAKALQPLYAGARAAIAHATSGGGKYYQPEVRDERYFSNDALRLMAKNLTRHGGRSMSRYDYGKPSPAMWEASQAVGGATVKDGKVTDVFDVDTKDPYGLSDGAHLVNGGLGAAVDLGHRALGLVFGDERDPAAGKVRTEIPLDAIRRAEVRQDAKGGDAGDEVTENAEIVNSGEVADTPVTNGPRIVVNPAVFRDKRDALCVAYNEAFRLVMAEMDFSPVSEPTEEQRKFFSDTAYANDEMMLRRTILARICVFDTSVKNPTDEQISEAVEFLEEVMKAGAPQSAEEQSVVQRAHDRLAATVNAPRGGTAPTGGEEPPSPQEPTGAEPPPDGFDGEFSPEEPQAEDV